MLKCIQKKTPGKKLSTFLDSGSSVLKDLVREGDAGLYRRAYPYNDPRSTRHKAGSTSNLLIGYLENVFKNNAFS